MVWEHIHRKEAGTTVRAITWKPTGQKQKVKPRERWEDQIVTKRGKRK